MITVPKSKTQSQVSGEAPSEAMMLMALAHMKQIGRIPPPDAAPAEPAAPDTGNVVDLALAKKRK